MRATSEDFWICCSPAGQPERSVPADAVQELRAKAERYRTLAEKLSDPRVIAVVYDCARELEEQAASIERLERWRGI